MCLNANSLPRFMLSLLDSDLDIPSLYILRTNLSALPLLPTIQNKLFRTLKGKSFRLSLFSTNWLILQIIRILLRVRVFETGIGNSEGVFWPHPPPCGPSEPVAGDWFSVPTSEGKERNTMGRKKLLFHKYSHDFIHIVEVFTHICMCVFFVRRQGYWSLLDNPFNILEH